MRLQSEPAALDTAAIAALVTDPEYAPAVEASVDSSNRRLAERRRRGESLRVLLAEQQTAGRGRQGRTWLSPPRRGLYLSMAYDFGRPLRELSSLSLVAGLAAADAIAEHSGLNVGLKWPNDLQIDGRKLGGCLIDLSVADGGASQAVIGIGINVALGDLAGPEQAWTDLVGEGGSSDRNRLAAVLINALIRDLTRFEALGFRPFQARWDQRDVLKGQALRIIQGQQALYGRGCGVDAQGALLVQTEHACLSIHAGEVSVRRLDLPGMASA
ncbi:MAG: biotin--[acetyl-CoA-carboxylase] ligase [Wenzhouxiangella sp.]